MTFLVPPSKVIGDNISETDWQDYIKGNLTDLDARLSAIALSGCRATRVSDQTISDTSYTLITWTGETFDVGGWFAPSSTTIIVPAAAIPSGYTTIVVQLGVQIYWEGSSAGTRRVLFLKNGSEIATSYLLPPTTAQMGITLSPPAINAVVGDTFSVEVLQTSGGNLKLQGSSQEHAFSCIRLGPY